MARKKSGIETKSQRRARMAGYADGRGKNQAYTSGAREVYGQGPDGKGVNMNDAHKNKTLVRTYTHSKYGRMSTNGSTAGGSTWTMTQKDANGNKIKQSGRNKIATRRQRYYDVRVGLSLSGG